MGRWNSKSLTIILCVLWLGIQTTQSVAFTVNEATDGDLLGIEQMPTPLTLELGTNTLLGSAGGGGATKDYDIFRFSIPVNMVLSAITLDSYLPLSGVSFLGMQTGTIWTAGKGPDDNPMNSGIDPDLLAGWTLFGANNIDEDLLPSMGIAGLGASGFDVPLGEGDYVFLIQDTGSAISYGLTFTASPVPLPASLPLLGLALISLLRRNSRSGAVI